MPPQAKRSLIIFRSLINTHLKFVTGKRQNEDVLPNEFTKYVNETIENNENHRNIYTREANPLTGRKSFIGDIKEAPNCDF